MDIERAHGRRALRALMTGLAVLLLLGSIVPAAAQQRAVVRDGFEDSLVASITNYPTDLAWMGNDLLIVTKGGIIYRVPNADPQAAPEVVLDHSAHVGTGQEQGMVGVVADPKFSATTNRFLYVYYTRNEGGCADVSYGVPPPDPSKCFNRVSRFTVNPDGTVDPASEKPLIPFIPVGIPNHNGGAVAFGKDGMLYISVGDGGTDTGAGTRKSQNLGDLHGKILRVRRDGTAPRKNPFAGKGSVACAKRATATAPKGKRCKEIFAYGLRNPYRITFDPNARGSVFYINDVGEKTWEEVNLGAAGANYGWPNREGRCPTGKEIGCKGTKKRFTDPIYAYNHKTGDCNAITGGAVVPRSSNWGPAYRGKYLFGDWTCETIFALTPRPKGKGYTVEKIAWPGPDDRLEITALLFDRSGNTLYYTSQWDSDDRSEVRAIRRAS